MAAEIPARGVAPGEHAEGEITERIEHFTSLAPSGLFLGLAGACLGASALLHVAGRKPGALFVGNWIPPILIMGLYNKIVKVHGSG